MIHIKKYNKSYERWQDSLPPEKLQQIYDKIGWNSWRSIFVSDLEILITKHETLRILDVGCFSGDYLQILIERCSSFDYIGVDVTPGYIDFARNRFSNIKCKNSQKFKFQTGNVFGLDFSDREFDVVMCTGLLHHLPELEKPLSEIARVCSKDMLFGVYIHDEQKEEIRNVKNGFLYKTWNEEFIIGEITKVANVKSVEKYKSPNYEYHHCSVIASKNS